MTIADGGNTEEADLVAGVIGYKVETNGVTDPESNTSYPVVQSAHGWGLLLKHDSAFR